MVYVWWNGIRTRDLCDAGPVPYQPEVAVWQENLCPSPSPAGEGGGEGAAVGATSFPGSSPEQERTLGTRLGKELVVILQLERDSNS